MQRTVNYDREDKKAEVQKIVQGRIDLLQMNKQIKHKLLEHPCQLISSAEENGSVKPWEPLPLVNWPHRHVFCVR